MWTRKGDRINSRRYEALRDLGIREKLWALVCDQQPPLKPTALTSLAGEPPALEAGSDGAAVRSASSFWTFQGPLFRATGLVNV